MDILVIKTGIIPDNVVKIGKWEYLYACRHCLGYLTKHEVMYSNSVCPYCGIDDGSTMIDCTTIVMRKLYTFIPKWWEFWKEYKYFIEPRDTDSRENLLKIRDLCL